MVNDMRSAAENRQFELRFQPVIDIATGHVTEGLLFEIGCDNGRGYLFSHPLSAPEFEDFLGASLEPVRKFGFRTASRTPYGQKALDKV